MAANDYSTAGPIAKKVYGTIRDLRPTMAKAPLQNQISFDRGNKLGDVFSETLHLADEAGITYGGSSSDLFNLNDAVPATSVEVSASGSEIVIRAQVTMKRLTATMAKGEAAFESFWGRMLKNNKNALGKRVDISLMYGGDDIGVVSGSPSGSSGARTITLTAASWLPLAFLGAKNAKIDVYSSGGTLRNTTTDITITAVTPSKTAPTIAVSGLEAELATIVDTDEIFFKGAYGNECTGMTVIAGLTGSETYLGLAANSYPDLWSGNPTAVGGNFSFPALQDAIMESQARGGGFPMYKFYCAHATWTTLSSDMTALRAIDSSYKTEVTEFGQRRLRFYCGNAEVAIEPTLNMKQGEALLIPTSQDADIRRIGTADVNFEVPGMGESYYHILNDNHGVEARGYSDQFPWSTCINSMVHFTGITHS